jgi:tRNA A-37 threonylcarbamoyl transferase component Bud32
MNDSVPELLSLCRRLLDPKARAVSVHAGHNGTVILRAMTAVGEVIVKQHRGLDRHRQELHAYRCWTPVLGVRAPQLLACDDDPPAIVVTALQGSLLADTRLTPAEEMNVYRQAGALLRDLHHAGEPRAEPDIAGWLADRGAQWLELAEDVLPTRRRAEIRSHLQDLARLGPLPAVPCHLDYTTRNLIVREAGGVAVIDFEHARYDLPARDLVRLATRVWTGRPDLEGAFLDGYGPLTDVDREVIEHCSHLDALTAAVRAKGHSPTRA